MIGDVAAMAAAAALRKQKKNEAGLVVDVSNEEKGAPAGGIAAMAAAAAMKKQKTRLNHNGESAPAVGGGGIAAMAAAAALRNQQKNEAASSVDVSTEEREPPVGGIAAMAAAAAMNTQNSCPEKDKGSDPAISWTGNGRPLHPRSRPPPLFLVSPRGGRKKTSGLEDVDILLGELAVRRRRRRRRKRVAPGKEWALGRGRKDTPRGTAVESSPTPVAGRGGTLSSDFGGEGGEEIYRGDGGRARDLAGSNNGAPSRRRGQSIRVITEGLDDLDGRYGISKSFRALDSKCGLSIGVGRALSALRDDERGGDMRSRVLEPVRPRAEAAIRTARRTVNDAGLAEHVSGRLSAARRTVKELDNKHAIGERALGAFAGLIERAVLGVARGEEGTSPPVSEAAQTREARRGEAKENKVEQLQPVSPYLKDPSKAEQEIQKLRVKLEAIAEEKEHNERLFRVQLKSRDESIAVLHRVNQVKEKSYMLLKKSPPNYSSQESWQRSEDGSASSGDDGSASSSDNGSEYDDEYDDARVEMDREKLFVNIMDDVTNMTETVNDRILESLRRKRLLAATLTEELGNSEDMNSPYNSVGSADASRERTFIR